MLTLEVVEKAKSLWKEVVTYTVNETWDFQTMRDLWVNIIMTDEINLLKNYNQEIQYMNYYNSY